MVTTPSRAMMYMCAMRQLQPKFQQPVQAFLTKAKSEVRASVAEQGVCFDHVCSCLTW